MGGICFFLSSVNEVAFHTFCHQFHVCTKIEVWPTDLGNNNLVDNLLWGFPGVVQTKLAVLSAQTSCALERKASHGYFLPLYIEGYHKPTNMLFSIHWKQECFYCDLRSTEKYTWSNCFGAEGAGGVVVVGYRGRGSWAPVGLDLYGCGFKNPPTHCFSQSHSSLWRSWSWIAKPVIRPNFTLWTIWHRFHKPVVAWSLSDLWLGWQAGPAGQDPPEQSREWVRVEQSKVGKTIPVTRVSDVVKWGRLYLIL